jgi:hypothetical protein
MPMLRRVGIGPWGGFFLLGYTGAVRNGSFAIIFPFLVDDL